MYKKIISSILAITILVTITYNPIFAINKSTNNTDIISQPLSEYKPGESGFEFIDNVCTYKVNKDTSTVTLIDGSNATGDFEIPSEVEDSEGNKYKVTEIGGEQGTEIYSTYKAFSENDNITSIKIPATVTKIGDRAFRKCSKLKNAYLNDCSSLQIINTESFEFCDSLVFVNLKNCMHLNTIGGSAFARCRKLETINCIGCTDLQNINFNAFYECTALKTIQTLDSSPVNVVDFSGCANLKTISDGAFSGCSAISSLNFNNCSSLESINVSSFYSCEQLKSTNFNGCTKLTSIGNGAFAYCKLLDKVYLDTCTSLDKIDAIAFAECSNLNELKLPMTLRQIVSNAFPTDNPSLKIISGDLVLNLNSSEFVIIECLDENKNTVNFPASIGPLQIKNLQDIINEKNKEKNVIVNVIRQNIPVSPENCIIKRDGQFYAYGHISIFDNFIINENEKLSIYSTSEITIPENLAIINKGNFENNGIINNNGTIRTEGKDAKTTNNITINNNINGSIITNQDALFINNGNIILNGGTITGIITGKKPSEPSSPTVPETKPENPVFPDIIVPESNPSYDYEPTPDIIVDTSTDDFAEGGNVTISGFNGVPNELKMIYGSVRDMKKYTEQAIAEYFEKVFRNVKFNKENTVFFNAELKPDADGKIYLPVPKNVDATKNKFVVAHIMKDGDIEVVEGKVTENGIEVTLNGLSPVMITWFSSDLSAGEGMVEVEESL